jgi:hypothetical protein
MNETPSGQARSRTGKKWRLFLVNLGIFLGLLTILGTALELGTRVFVSVRYGRADHGMYWMFRYEPYLLVRTDDRLHQPYPSKTGKFRILVLGGSTARNIPEDMLGEAFREILDGDVEVINLAQGGYIVDQELIVLGLHGVRIRPDLVITVDGANDIVNLTKTSRPGIHYTSTFVELAMNHPFRNFVFGMLRNSQFVNSVNKLYERRMEREVQQRADLLEENQRHYLESLESIATFSRGLAASYVAVLQPYLHLRANRTQRERQLAQNHEYRKDFMIRAYGLLRDGLRSHPFGGDVLIIDASAAFDKTAAECFIDEVHLTVDGNRSLSRFIAQSVAQSRLFEDVVPRARAQTVRQGAVVSTRLPKR